jgi:hypothetical protein
MPTASNSLPFVSSFVSFPFRTAGTTLAPGLPDVPVCVPTVKLHTPGKVRGAGSGVGHGAPERGSAVGQLKGNSLIPRLESRTAPSVILLECYSSRSYESGEGVGLGSQARGVPSARTYWRTRFPVRVRVPPRHGRSPCGSVVVGVGGAAGRRHA